ncbi:unnamed protein product [Cochlearia groenlandica]
MNYDSNNVKERDNICIYLFRHCISLLYPIRFSKLRFNITPKQKRISSLYQRYRGGGAYDWKPRMWYSLNHYSSMEKPSYDAGARGIKPRGTGVFLPARPVNSSEEKRSKKKSCPFNSSRSKQVFLPKEWAY